MNKTSPAWRSNVLCARRIWGQLPAAAMKTLKQLTNNLAVSVVAGDLQFLENRWYVICHAFGLAANSTKT